MELRELVNPEPEVPAKQRKVPKVKVCPNCQTKLELLPGGVVYDCPGCGMTFHKNELVSKK